jgi:hypothetical protein
MEHTTTPEEPQLSTRASSMRATVAGESTMGVRFDDGSRSDGGATQQVTEIFIESSSMQPSAVTSAPVRAVEEVGGKEGSFLHLAGPIAAMKGVRTAQNPLASVSATSAVSDDPYPPIQETAAANMCEDEQSRGQVGLRSAAADIETDPSPVEKSQTTPRFWGRRRTENKTNTGAAIGEGAEGGGSSSSSIAGVLTGVEQLLCSPRLTCRALSGCLSECNRKP